MLPALFLVLLQGAAASAASAAPAAASGDSALPLSRTGGATIVVGRGEAVVRSIAMDEGLGGEAGIGNGDVVEIAPTPGAPGERVRVTAIVRRSADPSEIARGENRVRLHLDQLQSLAGYGDRVDRFAVRTAGPDATPRALEAINAAAFGFRAWPSREIAVETSKTFLVVSRFHDAIGMITIVASAIFLLCILLLKVEERRRDVAALRLMGISRRSVVRSVVVEAAIVSLVGSALGTLVGWGASAIVNAHYRAVYRTPLTFSLVTPEIVLFAVALSVALGILAGWLAALRLAHTPPLALFGR
jgi:putative ABC transport system permease protein